jgi:hypothetical protein
MLGEIGEKVRKMVGKLEAKFLDEIQTKILRVSLLAIQSPQQLCLEISISSNSRNLLQFLQFSYCTLQRGNEKNMKENHTPSLRFRKSIQKSKV